MRPRHFGPIGNWERASVADDVLRGRAMRVRGYVVLSHVSTGELATAALHNTLLDDVATIKTNISDDGGTFSGLLTHAPLQTFRGLVMRTHQDSDKAANQIALLGLDEAQMDDGTRYSGLTLPLAADITASGAGGLDAGSRTASKWYEAWLIGKSSTKAASDLRLLLHRAKEYTIDQSQTTVDSSEKLRQGATDRLKLAQGFKATAGAIEFIDVKVTKVGAPTGTVYLTIETDTAGSPSGSVQATSDKIDVSRISTGGQTVRFIFRTPFTPATAATQYHMVLQGSYAVSASDYLTWSGNSAGGYANGSAKKFDGTSWAAAAGPGDFYFKLSVTVTNGTITYPAGWDESCKLGYVYNNSGNALVFFTQIDRTISYVDGGAAAVGSFSSAGPTIADLSALMPPIPCEVTWVIYHDTAGNYAFVAPITSIDAGGNLGPRAIAWTPANGVTAPAGTIPMEFQCGYIGTSAANADARLEKVRW